MSAVASSVPILLKHAIRPVNDTDMAIGWLHGRVDFPRHSLTLIVKGTFRLRQDAAAVPAEAPLPLNGDQHFDDDPEASLRYESDFAHFKPHADLLLIGSCHVPGGEPKPSCRVVFRVGDWQRTLVVVGPRYWQSDLFGALMSEPRPFRHGPVRYEHAFGGTEYGDNPIGKGIDAVIDREGRERIPLPNIELPEQMLTEPNQRPPPAGFGPLSRGWGLRSRKTGTYDERWLETRWPWFAQDLDWTFFNAAPPEQQLPGYLRGDETLYFENLSAVAPVYRSQLPGLRVHGFVDRNARSADKQPAFEEIPMHLDTLWVDMDTKQLVLVWRGVTQTVSEEFTDIDHLYVCTEPLAELLRSPEEAHQRMRAILAPPVEMASPAPPSLDVDAKIARAEAEYARELAKSGVTMNSDLFAGSEEQRNQAIRELYRKQLIAVGADPARADAWEPPKDESDKLQRELEAEFGIEDQAIDAQPLDRETCLQRIAAGESMVDADLRDIDLSQCVLNGVDFSGAVLVGADLSGADLSRACLQGANLTEADLVMADLRLADLSQADLTSSRLMSADLSGATLNAARFTGAMLRSVRMLKAAGRRTDFSEADLSQARLSRSRFHEADFSASRLDGTRFTGASLCGSHFEKVQGEATDFSHAELERANFGEGCCLAGARFVEVGADESIWDSADLRGCDFSGSRMRMADFGGANLTGANFTHCDLGLARFVKASLEDAVMLRANLFQSSLEKANLRRADLSGASLYEAETRDAILDETNLREANLKMSKLA